MGLLGLTLTPLPEGGWETRIQGYRVLVRQAEGGYEALCPNLGIQVERETLQEALEDIDTMVAYTVVEMLGKRAGLTPGQEVGGMGRKKKHKSLLQSLPRGHEWGRGRATQVHGDRRTKGERTRGDANRAAIRREEEI